MLQTTTDAPKARSFFFKYSPLLGNENGASALWDVPAWRADAGCSPSEEC